MPEAIVLLLTHSGDHYTIDLVQAAVQARGARAIRIDTDRYPTALSLSASFSPRQSSLLEWEDSLLEGEGQSIALDDVVAVWARRLWPGKMPAGMDAKMAFYARREAQTAFIDTLALLDVRWVNTLPSMARAESKLLQLQAAAHVGLTVPSTLITNAPQKARAFWHQHQGKVVTKLLGALTQTMNATGDFMYTSRVSADDLERLDDLQLCPQIFQREVDKAFEARCVVVGDQVFSGAIDAGAKSDLVDWRQLTEADGISWTTLTLPHDIKQGLLALTRALGLSYGAADFICTPEGEYVFLEINPAGEWGWLQRDLGLPIAEAIADELLRDVDLPDTDKKTEVSQ